MVGRIEEFNQSGCWLDRQTHHRLAAPPPKARQGLRELEPLRRRFHPTGEHPPLAAEAHKTLLSQLNLPDELLALYVLDHGSELRCGPSAPLVGVSVRWATAENSGQFSIWFESCNEPPS